MLRKRTSAKQFQMDIGEEPHAGWWACQGVFTPNYLRQHLSGSQLLPGQDVVTHLYGTIRARWLDSLPALRNRKESYTRQKFLDPTLTDLGWHYIPEADLPECPTRKTPDYCMFLDAETEHRVASADNYSDIFRASVSMLEAKKAQHNLDQVSKTETPGWFPSQQVQDYLWNAKDDTGRFFNWAILTNGNEWRLYSEKARPDAFFAFHLAIGEEFCPLDEFRLFVALFSPTAFVQQQDKKCLLDDLLTQSLTHQETLESNLRKRVFNVLEELAEGYYFNPANSLRGTDLPNVYEASLVFLYRLLFVLYAESRGLLPANVHGPRSNKRYREEFSLARFTEGLRDRSHYTDDAFPYLYHDLLKLFSLINGTRKEQNEALQVTRYNGGLFDPARYPRIDKWVVGEKTLARVLRQLMFVQPPARSGARQQVIETDETVDFGTLEVRQLGDIYEGLLGAHLAERPERRLELVNDKGENHQKGIFYTPDWVVRYLVKEALKPLVEQVEDSEDVKAAKQARSDEKRQNDAYALGVLSLKVVDPAMGSGHFLVRATECLAEQIVYHPTTRLKTDQVIANGTRKRNREDILEAGLTPVPPGVSQEQAETAYWRRRVVESCIYGVDTNPLAVELAKLSLWLTCIAVDEPLSFLDHHLREGNSLIGAQPEEAYRPPVYGSDEQQITVDIGDALQKTVAEAIDANMSIELEASTEVEIVKAKERRWREVQAHMRPFMDVLDLWIAALSEVRVNGEFLNAYQYRLLALHGIDPGSLDAAERRDAEALWKIWRPHVAANKSLLTPFHWQLEFPAVFYEPDGSPKPDQRRGFDAVLGNPPYISTHTSSEEAWRPVLKRRMRYLEDLYVHFTDLGFKLLRPGGTFGFIVSDTFFTLDTKETMREWLQDNRLTHLGQCDPFNATVDAAIFVARKERADEADRLLFIQARYHNAKSTPERELPELPAADKIQYSGSTDEPSVQHGSQGCLHVHSAPLALYRNALKKAFFEPAPSVLELYKRFNQPAKELVEEWWDRTKNSKVFAQNQDEIRAYQLALQPGDITLVGLIAEGGQGMRTADNARFLGYLAGTPQARQIEAQRERWTQNWLKNTRVGPAFRTRLQENGGNINRPTADGAAWEAAVTAVRADPVLRPLLGFRASDLYRIVPLEKVATPEDFNHTWRRRKAELLSRWQEEAQLAGFWQETLPGHGARDRTALRASRDITDEEFCWLCTDIQNWIAAQSKVRGKKVSVSRRVLGLRSSEDYTDPGDAPRIATIYNGLSGRGQWVPFRKGDPEGNRWADNEPLYIEWSRPSVEGLSTDSQARWQGHRFFLTPGVAYTLLGNHVALKAKIQDPCIFDAGASRLTSAVDRIPPLCLLALFNSDVFSYFLKKLLKNTQDFEISDVRMMPVVVPVPAQASRLSQLAECAIEAKKLTFSGDAPSNELVEFCRGLSDELVRNAPAYLRPGAQPRLLASAHDCLTTIELAVNWEAEKLYGVEGLGPFDEF